MPTTSPRPKPIGLFVVHAIALTLAIGFWPTFRAAYPPAFHAGANALFAWVETPSVRLTSPPVGSDVTTDTLMSGAPRPGALPVWSSWFSLTRIGWWPSAALLAMLLATPLTLGRRLVAVGLGLGLLHALTLGRLGVEIAYASYELAHGPGGPARGFGHLLLRTGSESLTATIPSAAFVFVCWALLASPRDSIDLSAARRVLGIPERPAAPPSDPDSPG